MERAEYHKAVDVNTEPLKWPIAPDGYIPNSVIRSWRRRGKGFTKADYRDDIVFSSLYLGDDTAAEEEEDVSTRIFWFVQDEEEDEKEKTDKVKGRGKQNKDEKKTKEEDKTDVKGKEEDEKREEITEVKRKESEDVKRETEEEKVGRSVLLKRSSNIQPEKNLQNQLKTFPDEKMTVKPQREEVGSKYSSRNVVSSP